MFRAWLKLANIVLFQRTMHFSDLNGLLGPGLFASSVIISVVIAGAIFRAKEPNKWSLLAVGLALLILPFVTAASLFVLETLSVKDSASTTSISNPANHLYAEFLRFISEVGVGVIAAGLCLPTLGKPRVVILHFEDADGRLPKEQLLLSGPMPAYRPGEEIDLFLTGGSVLQAQVVKVKHNISIAERENSSDQVHITVVYRQA